MRVFIGLFMIAASLLSSPAAATATGTILRPDGAGVSLPLTLTRALR
ncbi:MAG: hypothetical protein Q8T13_15960 [Acidobacteriota bacterium]|nr:hypothetical protein [Acidobacteriota bacterium]